ncbi:unnamed protein product [Adineta steineri]|uniref:EGF-like domain-containing protein n=1 Tax=Adineta steineri TaxID=433720 RepID=A0A814WX04_9BILA|nr:unnamed protein product [Adineta steineri]
MTLIGNELRRWIILILIGQVLGVSYNQPKFCPNPAFDLNATTFADISTIGTEPYDIFIDTNNTVYIPNQQNNRFVVWFEGNSIPMNISGNFLNPYSLFVTTSGDIYIDSDNSTGQIDKCTLNSLVSIPIMYSCQKCMDIFVDINNTIYCSMAESHQVITKSLNSPSNVLKIVAGTGTMGSDSYSLYEPKGIFVDVNFDLYVADSSNNRVQLFRSGELSGITIAGSGSLNYTFILDHPTAIVLDADKYLYIVDRFNHRIVASGPTGFRCLVACYHSNGTSSDQLWYPWSLAFDSYGNLFVDDKTNSRIQKFRLLTGLCDNITTTEETITSTVYNMESSTDTIQQNSVTISPSNTIVSYNQPKFNANASWYTDGITFATDLTVGTSPYGIFIDTNDTIYVADQASGQIQIWFNNVSTPTRTLLQYMSHPYALFIKTNGDIYIDDGASNKQVNVWSTDANSSIPIMYVAGKCLGLFIDISDVLYCSMSDFHQVVTKSLNSNSNTTTIIAGTGCNGSTSSTLWFPYGIFVDTNFDLYVADSENNRVQLFRSEELNGRTVAGMTSLNLTITLNHPTGIILDIDKYLFIVDNGNHRIVGSGPYGFRCLVGCHGLAGSGSSQLNYPASLSFDSYGNIFVTDQNNSRIQKFILNNTEDEDTTQQSTSMSTLEEDKSSSNPTVSNAMLSTTVTNQKAHSSSIFFVPPLCHSQYEISPNCNVSSTPCDMLQSCQNNGTCINNNNTNNAIQDYTCSCLSGFDGINCEIDNRPCQLNTCWNDGTCNTISNNTFECLCPLGWIGRHCETKMYYCDNTKCLNNGVCRSLLLNYTCECLGSSFSGQNCQITASRIVIYQTISKSFGYISIISIVAVFIFVFIMDILKYIIGIDPAKVKLKKKKVKRPKVFQRFVYINASVQPTSVNINKENVSYIKVAWV